MSFNPQTFLTVSKELLSGSTEAHYRSVINRAYYGAFGHIRNRLAIFVDHGSVHQAVINSLRRALSIQKRQAAARLEKLFEKRKEADYEHRHEVKAHNCHFWIKEAEDIIKLFDHAHETNV